MTRSLNLKWQDSTLKEFLKQFRSSYKTFRYHVKDIDHSFFINEIEGKSGFYHMTSQGSRVILGDYIEIIESEHSSKFQVTDVDYYCEPSDMWLAVLREI